MKRHPLFHPVIEFPEEYRVFDFSGPVGTVYEDMTVEHPWGVGKYDEARPAVYVTDLFTGTRNVHMGIDLFAPIGTPVHAFEDSRVLSFGYNSAPGDYGNTIVTETSLPGGLALYALYGHLNAQSLEGKREGQLIKRGEVLAWVGDRHENGDYPPHVHFQLSYVRPVGPDMPGAVTAEDRATAKLMFPDPRLVLGPLY